MTAESATELTSEVEQQKLNDDIILEDHEDDVNVDDDDDTPANGNPVNEKSKQSQSEKKLLAIQVRCVFGEAKIEDLSSRLQTQAVEQFKALTHAALGVSKVESSTAYKAVKDEEIDEAGIEPKYIELVIMTQAGVSRSKAVTALRNANGDIVSAITELTT
ncbi:hypothetical protein L7F22_012938 [Adiantum nelumboides]|nr:hypothetical protein [Adiantum nelumboides]